MNNYIKAENLKYKGTFIKKLIYIMPLLTLLIAVTSPRYFQMNGYNWWYILMIPSFIPLLCSLVNGHENKHSYRAVFMLPINLKKVWISKTVVIAMYLLTANFVLLLGASCGYLWLETAYSVAILKAILAVIVMAITTLWQIPLCMFLAKKIGLLFTILLNSGVGIIAGIIMADSSLWWLCPYSITSRLMCPILGILPNGLMADVNNYLLNSKVIFTGMLTSLAIFIILLYITSLWFYKQEAIK